MEVIEMIGERFTQIVGVDGSEITQTGVLRMAPDTLVGIEVRSVRGQFLGYDATVRSQKFLHQLGPIVDTTSRRLVYYPRVCRFTPTPLCQNIFDC